MKENATATRRRFLHTTVAFGACVGCGQPGSNGSEPEAFGDVNAGNVSELPVGTLRAIEGAPAYVGRDEHGLYAMTSTCTHEGCDMIYDGDVSQRGVYCSCHGSLFDTNGGVIDGPAHAPLTHFKVTVDSAGAVTVSGASKVAATTRLPVA